MFAHPDELGILPEPTTALPPRCEHLQHTIVAAYQSAAATVAEDAGSAPHRCVVPRSDWPARWLPIPRALQLRVRVGSRVAALERATHFSPHATSQHTECANHDCTAQSLVHAIRTYRSVPVNSQVIPCHTVGFTSHTPKLPCEAQNTYLADTHSSQMSMQCGRDIGAPHTWGQSSNRHAMIS